MRGEIHLLHLTYHLSPFTYYGFFRFALSFVLLNTAPVQKKAPADFLFAGAFLFIKKNENYFLFAFDFPSLSERLVA